MGTHRLDAGSPYAIIYLTETVPFIRERHTGEQRHTPNIADLPSRFAVSELLAILLVRLQFGASIVCVEPRLPGPGVVAGGCRRERGWHRWACGGRCRLSQPSVGSGAISCRMWEQPGGGRRAASTWAESGYSNNTMFITDNAVTPLRRSLGQNFKL